MHTELPGLREKSGMVDAVLGHHALQLDVGNTLFLQECFQASFIEAVSLSLTDHRRISQVLRGMRMKTYVLAFRAKKRRVRG